MKNNNKFLCIGQITAAHGILGHVRVRSYTDPAKKMFSCPKLYINDTSLLTLKLIRNDKPSAENTIFICQIDGITTRNAAELVACSDIYIYRQDLAHISADELYIIDIEGSIVHNAIDETILGTVKTIVNYGAGDIVEIITKTGESILVPFVKQYFPVIDIANKKLLINFPNYS